LYQWFIESPYRLRDFELQFRVRGPGSREVRPGAQFSRYRGAATGCALPVVHLAPGTPGYGEKKNPDPDGRGEEAFFLVRLPDGGQFSLSLLLERLPSSGVSVEAWVAGYEAPSRQAVERRTAPFCCRRGVLPVPHPRGFGRAGPLPVNGAGA